MEVPLGDTYYTKFTTRQFSTGAPFTLAGTPAVSVYEEGNLTQITAGITLTADYDTVTGLNDVAIVATSGNGYEAGKYYQIVITTGTVDSVSVVGEVVGEFRIVAAENTAGEKAVDVESWNGSAVTDSTGVPDVNIQSIDASAITAAAIATGAIDADAIASGAIDADAIAASAITAAKLASDVLTSDKIDATFVNEIWGKICETNGSRTAQQILSICLAALAGESTAGGATLLDPSGTNTRIAATLNASNERISVALTPSS